MFPLPFLQAWSQPGIKLFKSSRRASQLNRARRLRNPQGSGPRCTTPSPAPSPLPGGKSPNIRAGDTPRASSAVRSPSLSHKTTHPAPAGQRGLPGACWNKEPGFQGCTWPGGRSILVSLLARQRVAEDPVTRLVRLEQESLLMGCVWRWCGLRGAPREGLCGCRVSTAQPRGISCYRRKDNGPEGLRGGFPQPCNYPGAQVGLGAAPPSPPPTAGLPELSP